MKIDIFSHILPKKYSEAIQKKAKTGTDFSEVSNWILGNRALSDLNIRFKNMDRYPDTIQVLTLVTPPLEVVLSPKDAVELAKIANDELAELVATNPDKFIAAVACLPLNNIDASIIEADRAVTELKLRGVQIFTNVNGEALDEPKFRPLYEKMAHHDLPIFIHCWDSPIMGAGVPNNTPKSVRGWVNNQLRAAIGWDFETSLAMIRLAGSGIFADYPDIKFITHHCGGMVPTFERRIANTLDTKFEHIRKFYNDTALYGNTAGLMCGYAFFGCDHLVFGTDMPLGATRRGGYGYTLETIRAIEEMNIPNTEKNKIFEDNAKKLLKLTF